MHLCCKETAGGIDSVLMLVSNFCFNNNSLYFLTRQSEHQNILEYRNKQTDKERRKERKKQTKTNNQTKKYCTDIYNRGVSTLRIMVIIIAFNVSNIKSKIFLECKWYKNSEYDVILVWKRTFFEKKKCNILPKIFLET